MARNFGIPEHIRATTASAGPKSRAGDEGKRRRAINVLIGCIVTAAIVVGSFHVGLDIEQSVFEPLRDLLQGHIQRPLK